MTFDALKRLLVWAGLALPLNFLWEIAQLPLYTLWNDPDPRRIVSYVMHCVLGDLLIATCLYLSAALVCRNMDWPRSSPWRGGIVMVVLALIFTAFSEWYNVYRLGAWSYAPAMPLVFGIGLVPLLQWTLVPVFMIMIFRRHIET